MKKWLVVGCLGVCAIGLLIAVALGWYFLSEGGRILRMEMACNGGNGDECRNAADALRRQGYEARALVSMEKACALGQDAACGEMATAAILGTGLALAPDASRAFLEKACDSGAFRRRLPAPLGILACRRLGEALSSGHGLEKDSKRAAGFFDTACGEGDALSCGAQARLSMDREGHAASAERGRSLQATACHLMHQQGLLPLLLRIDASGWTLSGTSGTEVEVAFRLRDILEIRRDKRVHILWAREVSARTPSGLERLTSATETARSAGADPVLVLGEYEEYEAAVATSCNAAGEVWTGFLPPPPPPGS
jgi:hypothetical protein